MRYPTASALACAGRSASRSLWPYVAAGSPIASAPDASTCSGRHNSATPAMADRIDARNTAIFAAEKLSAEIAPPALSQERNLATASRSDLEALRRDLKAAEANATATMPRCADLLKTERDRLEAYALSLHADKAVVGRFLDGVDQRHAETMAFLAKML